MKARGRARRGAGAGGHGHGLAGAAVGRWNLAIGCARHATSFISPATRRAGSAGRRGPLALLSP
eukprot:10233971-Alexandrium_andersonii.AAC.1